MYWYDQQKHHTAHFHARHAGKEAVFDLAGNCIEGDLGSRASRLIQEWALEQKNALESAWKLALQGKEIPWINPLQ